MILIVMRRFLCLLLLWCAAKHAALNSPPAANFLDGRANEMLQRLKCDTVVVRSINSQVLIPSTYDYVASPGGSCPIVLLHGFDSSCLEYRRLVPALREQTHRTIFAPDMLGWGFGDYASVQDFGPQSKVAHLAAFLAQVVQQPAVLVGASLGGGIAITLAAEICPHLVSKVVLIDPQAFIDGVGQVRLPDFALRPLVSVLRSRSLRSAANRQSYFDERTFATEDALAIGNAHCDNPDWARASLSFLRSGGFKLSHNVPRLHKPTLLIWGRQDRILPPAKAVLRFQQELPPGVLKGVHYVENCGHVPHLEKPEEVAQVIADFVDRDHA